MGGIISWYSFNSPVEVYPVWPTVLAVNVREQLGRPVDCRYARLLRIKNDGPKNVEDSGQWVWRRCSAPVGPGRDKSGPAVSSDHQAGAVEGRQTGVGRGFLYFLYFRVWQSPTRRAWSSMRSWSRWSETWTESRHRWLWLNFKRKFHTWILQSNLRRTRRLPIRKLSAFEASKSQ